MKYIHPASGQFFAFNVWDIASAKAVIDASAQRRIPVILQTSMKAFAKLDKKEFRTFVSQYSEGRDAKVYLHLDHCRKQTMFTEAIDSGWDSVMIDASDRPLEENIKLTNEICNLAHERNVLVESEIGHVGGTEDDICTVEGGIADISSVEYFINHTAVDSLAVAIGTAHGLYHGIPELHYGLLEQTSRFSDIPLVIHGGTGLTDEMFRKLLSYKNVKKINISTDVKQAYLRGIQKSLDEGLLKKDGFDPLSVAANMHDCMLSMALHYLDLQIGGGVH